ncbi:MAG: hydroxyacid dehydrogenase [Candidatus Bathyarchaeia archaeon]
MPRQFKVLLVEKIDEAGLKLLESVGEVRLASGVSEETLREESRDVDAIVIRALGRITAKVMDNAPRLKVVGRHGVGVDNIDVEAATRRGIPVVYTPEANAEAVADHTMGLIIALAKNIAQGNYALKFKGNWNFRYEQHGVDVYGKTLGIIGLGRIGRRVAKRAKGFDMKVLGYDPYVNRDSAAKIGVELVDLETLLKSSDFVTVHVPLTEETRKLLGEREFSLMKPGAFLVNTSRGGVVDERAIIRALSTGRLAGAGLDVFEKEPPDPENPLFKFDNVVATPHMASHTVESLRKMALEVAEGVVKVLKGEKPTNIVNPEALKTRKGGEP